MRGKGNPLFFLNQDGMDKSMDQELVLNQDGMDKRMDKELVLSQDAPRLRSGDGIGGWTKIYMHNVSD